MAKKKVFLIIGLFWIVLIGGFVAVKEFTIRTGYELLLKTVPVDPGDPFSGDYVILSYDISTISTGMLAHQGADFKKNDKVYVLLHVGEDRVGSLANISKSKPKDGIFLKGVVKSTFADRLNVDYGIESYFVPEGKVVKIERSMGNIFTKVAVDRFGNAGIKAFVLDGQKIDFY